MAKSLWMWNGMYDYMKMSIFKKDEIWFVSHFGTNPGLSGSIE